MSGINLEDCIVRAVDIGVNTQTEEMLVVVSVDPRVDFSSPALSVLAWKHGIGIQDTSELDFQLDSTILVENPVHTVLVVGSCENVRDNELTASCDND